MIRKFLASLVALALIAAQAVAQDFHLGDAPAGVDLNFIGCTSSTSDLTTYTFAAHSVGATGDNRKTIVGVVAEDAATIYQLSTVTVGGASADVAGDNRGNASSPMGVYFAVIDNPSGTAEDIVLTFDEAITGATICVWAAYNMVNTQPVWWGPGSDAAGAAITLDMMGVSNAGMTAMCFGVSGSTGWSKTDGEGMVSTESADSSTAEWSYAAYTGRAGARQGLTQWTGDNADAVASICGAIWWRNGFEPRMYQVHCQINDTDLTTYTFTAAPTGVPHSSRKTVVALITEDAATNFNYSSGTVGGAASSELVETGTGALTEASIYYLDSNSAGDHEDIATTMSEAVTGQGICVYAVYNLASNTATGSVANQSNAAASMSADVACTGGGVFIAMAGSDTISNAATWTGEQTTSNAGFSSAEMSIGAFSLRWFTPGATINSDVDFAGTTADTSVAAGCWR